MYIEVVNSTTFDFVQSQIQSILSNVTGYNATLWAKKLFGNGAGGYYIPVPDEPYQSIPEIYDLISGYPQFATLPSLAPPNTFTPLPISDAIVYAAGDFVNVGKIATAAAITETYLLNYGGVKKIIISYRGGQIVILNINSGTYQYFDTGNEKPWRPIYIASRNELVFLSNINPNIFKLDLTTGLTSFQTTTGVQISSTTSPLQDRCLGTDGNIYFGTTTDARVFRFNPVTNVITALGQQYTGSSTYVYQLGADAGFTYALLRQGGNYWISIINNSTLAKTTVGLPTDLFKGGSISQYQDGANIFWRLHLRTSVSTPDITKDFINGIETFGLSPLINLSITDQDGYLPYDYYNPETWPTLFGVDTDFGLIDGAAGYSQLGYKLLIDPSFTTIDFTDVTKRDINVQSIEVDISNNLIGSSQSYAPLFKWNTSSDTLDQIHPINLSVYGIMEYVGNKIFIGGYANKTYQWNPSTAWDFLVNPVNIPFNVTNAYYHYFYAKSGDWVYSCQNRIRNDSGTVICMYNPTTEEIITPDTSLLALLNAYQGSHLFTINDGNKLVLIGSPNGGDVFYPRIFVWDISLNKNINDLTPTSFDLNIASYVYGGGYWTGTDEFIGFTSNVVYKVVLSPFSITYRNLPSTLLSMGFWRKSITQKSDGKILFLGLSGGQTYLYLLDGTTFTATKVSSALGSGVSTRCMALSGSKLYLFGGETSISQYMSQNSKYFLEKLTL